MVINTRKRILASRVERGARRTGPQIHPLIRGFALLLYRPFAFPKRRPGAAFQDRPLVAFGNFCMYLQKPGRLDRPRGDLYNCAGVPR